MSAEYMHIGIPITNKKPGMTYNEGAKFWVSNVDDYDYKIEYLKFEEGTPFPEVLHRCPHMAYKVDSLEKYIADADSVICGPMQANDQGDQLAFVWKDGAPGAVSAQVEPYSHPHAKSGALLRERPALLSAPPGNFASRPRPAC